MARLSGEQKCKFCGSTEHTVTEAGPTVYGGIKVLTAPCVPRSSIYFMPDPRNHGTFACDTCGESWADGQPTTCKCPDGGRWTFDA